MTLPTSGRLGVPYMMTCLSGAGTGLAHLAVLIRSLSALLRVTRHRYDAWCPIQTGADLDPGL